MAPAQSSGRRRSNIRSRVDDDDDDDNSRGPASTSRHRPAADDSGDDADVPMDGSFADDTADDQLVKKLVRYALACEYARLPIRRDGIREKVLGNNSRAFKRIFDGAQAQLRHVFGMEMTELPAKEKRTLKERQKATARKAATQGGTSASTSTGTYILVSTLPAPYRAQTIVDPARAPSAHDEATYVAFYTLIISVITLSGGELSDSKLKRYLTRLNAGQNLPIDSTENVLQRMVKHGYLDKTVERATDGDDMISWAVGPRGRVEVPPQSIATFVRQVYGQVPDDFDKKLHKSLGLQNAAAVEQADSSSRRD
ncbi:MAGE family-domain-containing protein [Microdochium trichocladiopsis]|uniref:MAGE family-domain-containing protein n=1 Tax=Microdochium trichocladiopsis TaxID=1682393 RepID=A0A9P8YEX6_9PEZI|nr:MAGE family-domain-containing protein [Microdochium trichocladiopsis]KAH7037637.1 MAGE family-domain-containing protein [Microdochium trichocladiopsis]